MSQTKRQYRYTPRGAKTHWALRLIGLLGFATVRQLYLTIWGNERSTNGALNRLVEHHFLHEAHELVDGTEGRGNRIVFLSRQGVTWLLDKGHLREDDIAYYWRGEGHWHPTYNEHDIAVHDVLCSFIKAASEHPEGAIDIRLDPHPPLGAAEEQAQVVSPLSDSRLLPDRIFALKHDEQFAEIYLEVDMGTEPKNVWREKMEKYLASPEVMDDAGVYVLCVAHTKRRKDTLLRWSEDIVDGRFLFARLDEACHQFDRKGKKLKVISAGDPFGDIWTTVSQTERPIFVSA